MAETRHPNTAANLRELCDILNEWARDIAYEGVTDYPCDLTDLPVYGIPNVQDTTEVWSWDDDSVLVNGPHAVTAEVEGWTVRPRCRVCGEATFNCGHGND